MTATHELKTWPALFEPVWTGQKTFEIRFDDRAYQRGDRVVLREFDRRADCSCLAEPPADHDDTCTKYSGRQIKATIGHVTASTPARGSQRGFQGNGYVVFSLVDVEHIDAPAPGTDVLSRMASAAAALGPAATPRARPRRLR